MKTGIESIKMFPSGDYLIFARIDGVLVKKRYSGYSVNQARKLFKQEFLNK